MFRLSEEKDIEESLHLLYLRLTWCDEERERERGLYLREEKRKASPLNTSEKRK